jgi:hypothetical protein
VIDEDAASPQYVIVGFAHFRGEGTGQVDVHSGLQQFAFERRYSGTQSPGVSS